MKTLVLKANLDENLTSIENIKLIAKKSDKIIVGETEIPINKNDVWDERKIKREKLHKKAKWYAIDYRDSKDKCYILASFILFKIIIPKQEQEMIRRLKEYIEFDEPEKISSYLLFFIIGYRNLQDPLDKASLLIKYDNKIVKELRRKNIETHRNFLEIDNENHKKEYSREKGIYNYNHFYVINFRRCFKLLLS